MELTLGYGLGQKRLDPDIVFRAPNDQVIALERAWPQTGRICCRADDLGVYPVVRVQVVSDTSRDRQVKRVRADKHGQRRSGCK